MERGLSLDSSLPKFLYRYRGSGWRWSPDESSGLDGGSPKTLGVPSATQYIVTSFKPSLGSEDLRIFTEPGAQPRFDLLRALDGRKVKRDEGEHVLTSRHSFLQLPSGHSIGPLSLHALTGYVGDQDLGPFSHFDQANFEDKIEELFARGVALDQGRLGSGVVGADDDQGILQISSCRFVS
jgi:hypothetical protein